MLYFQNEKYIFWLYLQRTCYMGLISGSPKSCWLLATAQWEQVKRSLQSAPLHVMQISGNDPFTFREGLANFNEHDITSLFSVISGHFLLGGNPDVENFNFDPSHVCPEPACGKKFNSATVLEKHRKDLLLSLVSFSSTSYLTLFAQEPQPQSHKAAAGLALQRV